MSLISYNASTYVQEIGSVDSVLLTRSLNDQLFKSVKNNESECIENLLERKANLDARNHKGETPLQMAARKGHSYVVMILLAHKANQEVLAKDTCLNFLRKSRMHFCTQANQRMLGVEFEIDAMTKKLSSLTITARKKRHSSEESKVN